ncbi:MAG TPA: hypothetical protein VLL52_24720 [Anaerolineae bacterium]|nr:hypothetical protein [Anaerolineae bacterium]
MNTSQKINTLMLINRQNQIGGLSIKFGYKDSKSHQFVSGWSIYAYHREGVPSFAATVDNALDKYIMSLKRCGYIILPHLSEITGETNHTDLLNLLHKLEVWIKQFDNWVFTLYYSHDKQPQCSAYITMGFTTHELLLQKTAQLHTACLQLWNIVKNINTEEELKQIVYKSL